MCQSPLQRRTGGFSQSRRPGLRIAIKVAVRTAMSFSVPPLMPMGQQEGKQRDAI
jgi:hypothetical protein